MYFFKKINLKAKAQEHFIKDQILIFIWFWNENYDSFKENKPFYCINKATHILICHETNLKKFLHLDFNPHKTIKFEVIWNWNQTDPSLESTEFIFKNKQMYLSHSSVFSNLKFAVCETSESLNKRFSTLYITEHTCPMLPAYFKTNHNGLLTVGHIPKLLMTLLPNNILQGFNYRTYASLVRGHP